MKDVVFAQDEFLIATLVPDDPEHLYKHKNQVAAVTNKRLLFTRYTGVSRSFEGSYAIDSIDLRHVARVRQITRLAIGGLLGGLFLIALGTWIAYGGATLQLIGPGVVFIPLLTIPAGLALILGLKRRVLQFETAKGSYKWKWTSDALAYRKTAGVATDICAYFDARAETEYEHNEASLPAESVAIALGDYVLWYHYVFIVLLPYIAVFWGIVNLIRGKRRSGAIMCLGSITWIILINVLIFIIATSQGL